MKTDLLADLGFAPPVVEYVRDDPRGYEYGYYGVEMDVVNGESLFTVSKYSTNKCFEFTLRIYGDVQFTKWVENTF